MVPKVKDNMHPILFRIGSLPINTYGLTLAVSFVLGLWLAAHRAEKIGIRKDAVYDLGIRIMIAAIVGSRFFYVVTHVSEFQGQWLNAVAFWNGLYGLSMLGGVLLAIAVGILTILKRKLPMWQLADAMIPSFALGIFVTRIGCFFNGCCFGSETSCAFGISFPNTAMAYSGTGILGGTAIHPTQLYSSIAGLFMVLILLWADRRAHFKGFIFSLFIGLYGATRFGIEEFRYFDHEHSLQFLGKSAFSGMTGITDNQLISLIMFIASIILGLCLCFHSKKSLNSS